MVTKLYFVINCVIRTDLSNTATRSIADKIKYSCLSE